MGHEFSKDKFRVLSEWHVARSGNADTDENAPAFIGLSATGVYHAAARQVNIEGNHLELSSEVSAILLVDSVLVVAIMSGDIVFYILDGSTWLRSDSIRNLHKEGYWISGLARVGVGSVASVGTDGCLCIWAIEGQTGRFSALKSRTILSPKAFTAISAADNAIFCVGNDSMIVAVGIGPGVVRLAGHLSGILAVDSVGEYLGGLVATGGEDKTVRIWSLEDIRSTETVLHATQKMANPVRIVKFSKEGLFLAAIAANELVVFRIVSDPVSRFLAQPIAHKTFSSLTFISSFCWASDNSKIYLCCGVWRVLTFATPRCIHDKN